MKSATYYLLVDKLRNKSVFYNNFNNLQMPVYFQIFIVLKCFGAYNRITISKIADWAEIEHEIVNLI